MSNAVRRLLFSTFIALSLCTVVACDTPPDRNRRDAALGDGEVPIADEDGDGISDHDEGRATNRDTDGDGTPDYRDEDSDDDGIFDRDEAGDTDPRTPPRDTDSDTIPDYIDDDSDNNGILDADEAPGDVDGDGRPNYADMDDDGDNLSDARELRGMLPPVDSDGDGTADYHDPDADNDTILDGQDGDVDTDGDGTPNFLDIDSDEDSIPDRVEAGDADILTPPFDTDGDGTPDFRDPDSDGDGLSDRDEVTIHGTRPNAADSDGDGVSDLIEVAAGTDPRNDADSPRTRGDFVFVVPYQQDPDPTRDTLDFRTNVQFADIYFGFDTTGSMSAELSAMRNATSGVPAIIAALRCAPTGGACALDSDCATGVCFAGACVTDPNEGEGCIPDMWTGVARWDDLHTFRNLLSLQPDPVMTANAVPGTGGGGSEAPYHPPYCAANRATTGCANCAMTGIGCGGFREDAIRIYIQVTDADQQCSGSACSNYTAAGAGAALSGAGVRFISLFGTDDAGGTGTPESVARDIGIASGSVDATGSPFVYPAVDAAVVPRTVQAVRAIVRGVPLRVTIQAEDEEGDAGDALQFIERLETNTTTAGCSELPTEDATAFPSGPPDGIHETFPAVTAGNRVCWDVVPRRNETVMPALTPQVFRARLTVYGDGSPLDDRTVYFLVPPRPPEIEGPG